MCIIHRLHKENQEKEFFPVSSQAVCPNMKPNTLEKVFWALEDFAPRVTVPEEIRRRAKTTVELILKVP